MSSLKKFLTFLLDWNEYGKAYVAGDHETPSVCTFSTLGNGRAVKAYLYDKYPDSLRLRFERKIAKSDVLDGQLVPIVREQVKHRGGKRHIDLCIDLDTAKRLQKLLGEAIHKAEKRQQKVAAMKRFSNFFENLFLPTHE